MRKVSNLKKLTYEEKKARSDSKKAEYLERFKMLSPKIRQYYDSIPSTMELLYLKVHCGRPSQRERVKLKCLDCGCWQRDEVTNCNVEQCPLWAIRPYQK
jgi:hypothetical protein